MEKVWKKDLSERPNAVFLVKNLLGCTCPEEIFDDYQVRSVVVSEIPAVQLIMGKRLLLWIVDGARISRPEETLPHLLKQGLAQREDRGLNRFRMVVVGNFVAWEGRWGQIAEDLGPRVHLHVLPALFRGNERSSSFLTHTTESPAPGGWERRDA